jgi:glycosyltransferase involved in cell wall biosynthesis
MPGRVRAFLKQRIPVLESAYDRLLQLQDGVESAIHNKLQEAKEPRRRRGTSGTSVFYLTDAYPNRPPTRHEYANGGKVKTVYLAEEFPHSYPYANILYAVSSIGYPRTPQLVAGAKRRRLKIIVNQNGVAYQAWHGPGWEDTNQHLKSLLDQADYMIYQSRFCQIGAEKFLSPPNVPYEVIYNPVDTNFFIPCASSTKPKDLTLLLGGTQNARYRLELALQTLKALIQKGTDAKLIVTGSLWHPAEAALQWAKDLLTDWGLLEKVTFIGQYSQNQAPLIFNRAHVLLHTQYNDASPTLVLEAMASGLPVVYLDSGGTPELVADAGIGVPVEQSWESINLPNPEEMGRAVMQIMSNYREYADIARDRAVTLFSLEKFIAQHRRVFEKVLGS